MNKDFNTFQKQFKIYQKAFGLNGYKVYFKYEPLEESFAHINLDHVSMTATVALNSKLDDKDKPFKHINLSAKHEATHLLLGRLESLARNRYVFPDEIYEACGELVNKLEQLIDPRNLLVPKD